MNALPLIQSEINSLSYAASVDQIAQIKAAESEIEKLVASHVNRALRTLGDRVAGNRAEGAVLPVHTVTEYWLALLRQIAAAHPEAPADPGELHATLLRRLPFYAIELNLINRIGPQVARIATHPEASLTLELLFQDDLMTQWYRHGVTFQVFYRQIKRAMEIMQEAIGRPLHVLEVGAGTGGLTFHLQDYLTTPGTNFTFTDTSRYFLRLAKTYFSKAAFKYQVFDLEKGHLEQGFPAGQYDVVLASNVVHDTKNLDFALANILSLLKPGGYLVMLELTAPQTWWHMCFGSLDGWWRFKLDPSDCRKGLMILTDDAWLSRLRDNGYAGARNVSRDIFPDFANCVIIAQKSVN